MNFFLIFKIIKHDIVDIKFFESNLQNYYFLKL